MRDRLFGKSSEKTAKSEAHHRSTPTPEQRDRVLAAHTTEKPQHMRDDHLSPTAINRTVTTDLVALRDKVLREARDREKNSAENDRRSHDHNPPTLER